MPYTDYPSRARTRAAIAALPYKKMAIGDLTYTLYQIVVNWAYEQPENFSTLAQTMGALRSLTLEYERNHVVPYEEQKRKLNGDVLPYPWR